MKDVLTVGKAIELFESNHTKEAESLRDIIGNIKLIDGDKFGIPPLLNNFRKSFKNVMDAFRSAGVDLDGVYFNVEDAENELAKTNEEIKTLDQELEAARVEYSKYNNVNYEPGLNTIERNAILAEKKVIWDKIAKKRDDAWKKYRKLEEFIAKMKENAETVDVNSFKYLSGLFLSKKDELLASLNSIEDESLRIDVETDIGKIGKLINSIQEKEKAKEAEIAKISEIGKKLKIEIVYDKGLNIPKEEEKTEEVKKEVVEEPVKTEPVSSKPVEEPKALVEANPFRAFDPKAPIEDEPKENKNDSQLIDKVIALNPGKNVRIVIKDGAPTLLIDFPGEFLTLPEGFKYSYGIGINNKVDDYTDYDVLPVEEELSKSYSPISEEPTPEVKTEKPVVEENTTDKKHRVTAIASAIIQDHAKAMFHGAAIASIAIGIAGMALAPGAVAAVGAVSLIAGAGFSEAVQKLYNKITGNTDEKNEKIEKNTFGELTKAKLTELLAGIKELIKVYPKIKRGKHERRKFEEQLTADISDIPSFEDAQIDDKFEEVSVDDILKEERAR